MRPLWHFVNSAFGIWLLSTIVVVPGAAILTDQQNCRTQATQLSERYSRISGEVRQREAKLFRAILAANSADQVASALTSFAGPQAPYRYLEFKDRTLVDLKEEYDELSYKLNPPIWGKFVWGEANWTESKNFLMTEKFGFITTEKGKFITVEDAGQLASANRTLDLALDGNQFDIAELKKAVQELAKVQPAVRSLDFFLSSGRQCTIRQAIKDRVGF